MERFMCLLIGFIYLSCAGWNVISADIQVIVEPESLEIHSGDPTVDREITCEVGVTMVDMINSYKLFWISPEGKTLNRLIENEDGVSKDKYIFKISTSPSGNTILTMVIKNFDGDDAGTYICELSTKRTDDARRWIAEFKATAKYDIDSLKIKINDDTFDKSTTDPVQLAENTYKIVCISKGSNPPADLSVFIHSVDGEERRSPAPLRLPSIRNLEGRVETFDVRYEHDVGLSENDNKITCKAEVPGTEFLEKRVSVGLQVLPIEPIFECGNTSAEVGEENVVISCNIISYHPMKGYAWFEENNENVITTNASSYDNLVSLEHKNEHVDGKYTITTHLEIRQAQSYLFNTLLYLEVEAHHGEFFRHTIKLKKIHVSSSSTIYSSVFVLFAAILLTYLFH